MKYTYTDTTPFKVVNYQGKTLRDTTGKLLTGFKGYKDAKVEADKVGGVAIRS